MDERLMAATSNVVAAYLHTTKHVVHPNQVGALIEQVSHALRRVRDAETGDGRPAAVGLAAAEAVLSPKPAVSIEQSIQPDYIVCLEDGAKLKMLKRHLMAKFNLSPEQYRARWGLSKDYPMVAPNYSRRCRQLAVVGRGRE